MLNFLSFLAVPPVTNGQAAARLDGAAPDDFTGRGMSGFEGLLDGVLGEPTGRQPVAVLRSDGRDVSPELASVFVPGEMVETPLAKFAPVMSSAPDALLTSAAIPLSGAPLSASPGSDTGIGSLSPGGIAQPAIVEGMSQQAKRGPVSALPGGAQPTSANQMPYAGAADAGTPRQPGLFDGVKPIVGAGADTGVPASATQSVPPTQNGKPSGPLAVPPQTVGLTVTANSETVQNGLISRATGEGQSALTPDTDVIPGPLPRMMSTPVSASLQTAGQASGAVLQQPQILAPLSPVEGSDMPPLTAQKVPTPTGAEGLQARGVVAPTPFASAQAPPLQPQAAPLRQLRTDAPQTPAIGKATPGEAAIVPSQSGSGAVVASAAAKPNGVSGPTVDTGQSGTPNGEQSPPQTQIATVVPARAAASPLPMTDGPVRPVAADGMAVSPTTGQSLSGDMTVAKAPPPAPSQGSPAVQQVIEQVVRRFDGRSSRFEIRLDPPELGKIDVKIEVGPDNRVNAVFAARDPAALDAMMRGAKTLENALLQAGINLDEQGLRFEMQRDGRGAFQPRDGDSDHLHKHGRGEGPGTESLADEPTEVARSPLWDVRTRLDLTA